MRLSAALVELLGRYLVRLLDPFVTLLAAKNPRVLHADCGRAVEVDVHEGVVALAVIGPLAAQQTVSMAEPQWCISDQRLNDRYQGVIKRCSMTPPRLALVVALELAGALNPPHADRRGVPARCRSAPACLCGLPLSPQW